MSIYDDLPEPKRTPHPGECQICHTFRADGLPPTVHKLFCPHYVDHGVLRMADSATDPRRRFPR